MPETTGRAPAGDADDSARNPAVRAPGSVPDSRSREAVDDRADIALTRWGNVEGSNPGHIRSRRSGRAAPDRAGNFRWGKLHVVNACSRLDTHGEVAPVDVAATAGSVVHRLEFEVPRAPRVIITTVDNRAGAHLGERLLHRPGNRCLMYGSKSCGGQRGSIGGDQDGRVNGVIVTSAVRVGVNQRRPPAGCVEAPSETSRWRSARTAASPSGTAETNRGDNLSDQPPMPRSVESMHNSPRRS